MQCTHLPFQFPPALVKILPTVFGAYVMLPRSPARDEAREGGAGREAAAVLFARKQL